MRLSILSILAVLAVAISACRTPDSQKIETFSNGLKFCEGTTAYGDKILITNFGGDNLAPLNTNGKGYVMALEGGELTTFIECDGNLSAPKGMCVVDNYLLIADVNKVVVYNLAARSEAPQIVQFPEGELFVNDIATLAGKVLISVTNTGSIYSLDTTDLANASTQTLKKAATVAGANGLAVSEGRVYIASYDPSNTPTAENVIYVAILVGDNLAVKPLTEDMPYGQYDGVAITEDGKTLITTTWTSSASIEAAVWSIGLESGAFEKLPINVGLVGPADITISGGRLWIPELVNSKLYSYEL